MPPPARRSSRTSYPADGEAPTPSPTPSATTARVRLARFKQPSRIEVVDALPLTVTGKVQKGRLRGIERRALAAEGLLE